MALTAYIARTLKSSFLYQCKRTCSTLPIASVLNDPVPITNSTLPNPASVLNDPVSRTSLQPTEHTEDHLGMWYTINQEKYSTLFSIDGFPGKYKGIFNTFDEISIMIRKPALEVINYIKKADYNQYAYKYLLYGCKGVGRTFSIIHILNYLHDNKFLIVHTNNLGLWQTKCGEIVTSQKDIHTFDHTVDAVQYLKHFKNQNIDLIRELQLKTKEPYVINQRETIQPGNLENMLDYGINKGRFAAETVKCLFKEIIIMTENKEVKLAVVVDGINSLFQGKTLYSDGYHHSTRPLQFTLIRAFNDLITQKWRNGCIIGVIDAKNSQSTFKRKYTPRYLLREKGWDGLDPFLPIEVQKYNKEEFRSTLLYYNDRKWLQHPMTCSEQGVIELEYYSAFNPRVLFESCRSK